MQFTIFGFSQIGAFELGLNCADLCMLRWFINFKNSGKMVSKSIDGKKYYWVSYEKLAQELPVVACKKDTIYRKLTKLVKLGVLDKKTVKQGGTFSFYSTGINYHVLLKNTRNQIDVYDQPKNSCNQIDVYNQPKNAPDTTTPENPSADIAENTPIDAPQNPPIKNANFALSDNSVKFSQKQSEVSLDQLDIAPSQMEISPTKSEVYPAQLDIRPNHPDIYPNNSDKISNQTDIFSEQKINIPDQSTIQKPRAKDSDEFLLAEYLITHIQSRSPHIKRPNMDRWASVFAYMLNVESRTTEEITDLIDWIYKPDNFWCCRILDADQLKNKFDKLLAIKLYEDNNPRFSRYSTARPDTSNPDILVTDYGVYDLSGYELIGG